MGLLDQAAGWAQGAASDVGDWTTRAAKDAGEWTSVAAGDAMQWSEDVVWPEVRHWTGERWEDAKLEIEVAFPLLSVLFGINSKDPNG